MTDNRNDRDEAPLFPPGTVVDDYRILRQIGRGGMGEVYLARDTKLGRRVALKIVLSGGLLRAEVRDRFLREARLTARFNHPHIITIYSVGQFDGMPYVALEFLEGENLADRLAEEPPGMKQGLRVALAVAEALAEAHRHEVLHRDLKPENVFLPRDGRLRVLDFGLAKRVEGTVSPHGHQPHGETAVTDAESADADNLFQTQSLGVQGTPLYMAPEQWLQTAGAPADIWALGLILWELFAGVHPLLGHDFKGLWAAAMDDKPLPSLAAASATVPHALVDLVDACVDKKPERRPSASEVVVALGGLLADAERSHITDESPFRGLLPFHERHAHLFYGRAEEVAAFVERLRQTPVLPVVGPSGAGKSSFVQAGVIPRLREHGRWLVLSMRPGSAPFQTLANRLLAADSETSRLPEFAGNVSGPRPRISLDALLTDSVGRRTPDALNTTALSPVVPKVPAKKTVQDSLEKLPDAWSPANSHVSKRPEPRNPSSPTTARPSATSPQLAHTLREYPQRLALSLGELAEAENCHVLLLVDQLEELYTLVPDETVRRAFMQALCTAADDPGSPVRVVFTLRDDFLWRLAEGPEAREVLGCVSVLRPPDSDALVETLTEPVTALGYAYEDDDLPREMVDEVYAEPAALPLLQFAAQQLWRKRDRRAHHLTRQAYSSIGGVAGALARHADGVLKAMTSTQVDAARRILLRLVTPDSTRQVCSRSELTDGLGPEAQDVIERLTRERIVLTRKGRSEAELELAHESLIRVWSRLARWLEESREERAFLDEVGQAATLWRRRGQPEHEVWHGAALADGLRQARRCATIPSPVRAFLEAGQRRDRRRVRGRKLLLAAGMAALTLVAIGAVVVSLALSRKEHETRRQRDRAQRQQTEALRQRTEAVVQRTEALREGARSALARSTFIEARAKLRGALEARDSTLARALWWRLSNHPLLWKKNLSAQLYGVSFAPNGRTLAVSSLAQTVHLLDLDTGHERVLRGHRDQVYKITHSRDGRFLASGAWNGEIIVWDAATGKRRTTIRETGGGWGLDFSPDGSVLASGGKAPHVELIEVSTGKILHRLTGHDKSIYDVAWSPDGRILASASADRTIRLWDVKTKRSLKVLTGHRETVTRLSWSPDGRILASASADRTIRLWDVKTKRSLKVLTGHRAAVYGVAFSPNGRILASASHDRMIYLWRVTDGAMQGRFEGHTARIWELAFSPDGQRIASVGSDTSVRVWKVSKAAKRSVRSGNASPVLRVAFSPDGATLATAGQDPIVRVWDRRQGRVLMALVGHAAPVNHVAYDRANRHIVTSSDDRTIRVWDLHTQRTKMVLQGHTAAVYGALYSTDDRLIISAAADHTIRLWDGATGRSLAVLRGHGNIVRELALSPDGRRIASVSTAGSIRLWDLVTRRQVARLRGSGATVTGVAFGPEGKYLASTGGDQAVRLWELKTSRYEVLGRHPGRVYRATFHPGGRLVATSCADGVARIWDRNTRKALEIRGHRGEVNHVAFSPDGHHLATTGDDHTVRLWNVRTGVSEWRAPLLMRSTLELSTHRGWIRLAPDKPHARTAPAPKGAAALPSWKRAVERKARLADATPDGGRLCLLTHGGVLQQWDTGKDRHVSTQVPNHRRVTRLLALWDGCVTLEGGALRYHPRVGPTRLLKKQVTAMATKPGPRGAVTELLVAAGGRVHCLNAKGAITRSYRGATGVTALARMDGWIALGFKDGGMELVPADLQADAPRFSFESTPASPVVTLAQGPRGLLIAGFGNGALGIWSVANGALLDLHRLHGPVRHLHLRDHRLFAASELGDHRTLDLSAFHTPYCTLMRAVWKRVPIQWKNGVPVHAAPPLKHRCRRLAR